MSYFSETNRSLAKPKRETYDFTTGQRFTEGQSNYSQDRMNSDTFTQLEKERGQAAAYERENGGLDRPEKYMGSRKYYLEQQPRQVELAPQRNNDTLGRTEDLRLNANLAAQWYAVPS